MDDSIEIFSIENKNDIDNYSTQIESCDDFGDVFEDFDPDSDPRQVFYFFIRVELWDSIFAIFGFFGFFFSSVFGLLSLGC